MQAKALVAWLEPVVATLENCHANDALIEGLSPIRMPSKANCAWATIA